MTRPLFIYNLFPRLYPNTDAWITELDHIVDMGFNAVFINPFHRTGMSGSLYSVYDYFQFDHKVFPNANTAENEMKAFLNRCRALNLDVIMDLVASHTAIDSPLVQQHRNWYVSTESGDVMRPFAMHEGHKVVWGDLAKLDHQNSADRENLWHYFVEVCRHYQQLGFTAFRCDAAYQIQGGFWSYLIRKIKSEFPDTLFLAETLGCSFDDTCRMGHDGFDYIFNSSKWWDLRDPWCLDSYQNTRHIAPSISFPETHDTARLMAEVKGNETEFLQRLYLSCFFSKGVMVVGGLEYGFMRQPHCVSTTSIDWEVTDNDYSKQISQALQLKSRLAPLHEEGPIEAINLPNEQILCLVKYWCGERVMLVVNRDIHNVQDVYIEDMNQCLHADKILDLSPENRMPGYHKMLSISLQPGEVKIFASESVVRDEILV